MTEPKSSTDVQALIRTEVCSNFPRLIGSRLDTDDTLLQHRQHNCVRFKVYRCPGDPDPGCPEVSP